MEFSYYYLIRMINLVLLLTFCYGRHGVEFNRLSYNKLDSVEDGQQMRLSAGGENNKLELDFDQTVI